MREKCTFIIVFFFMIIACINQSDLHGPVIASVEDKHLYYSDIEPLLPENYTIEDSANFVRSYLDTWAKKQLLLEKAELNLSNKEIADFDEQIKNYREDLLINLYKQYVVSEQIDTNISSEEIKKYYDEYRDTFRLNEHLIQLSYIILPKNSDKIDRFTSYFRSLDKHRNDQEFYELIFHGATDHLLNDSIWVRMDDILKKIPPLAKISENNYLIHNRTLRLEDSVSVYLARIKQVKRRKEIAPIEHVQSIISKLILNKRRLQFIRKMETELLNSAIQDKKYMIYEK